RGVQGRRAPLRPRPTVADRCPRPVRKRRRSHGTTRTGRRCARPARPLRRGQAGPGRTRDPRTGPRSRRAGAPGPSLRQGPAGRRPPSPAPASCRRHRRRRPPSRTGLHGVRSPAWQVRPRGWPARLRTGSAMIRASASGRVAAGRRSVPPSAACCRRSAVSTLGRPPGEAEGKVRVPVAAETGVGLVVAMTLLLAAACVALLLRTRKAQRMVGRLQERERVFRMALWASSQRYWDFHVPTARLGYLVARNDRQGSRDFSSEQADPAAVIHPEDLPGVVDAMHRYVAGETPEFNSEHHDRADCPTATRVDSIWIRARGRAVEFNPDGSILRLAGTSLDIGRSRAVERENRIASEVLRSMNEAVAVLDAQFRFLSVNPAFARITGHDGADVAGRGAEVLDSIEHEPSAGRAMREALERDGRWSGEMWQRQRSGEEFLCSVEAATVLGSDSDGERMYVLM